MGLTPMQDRPGLSMRRGVAGQRGSLVSGERIVAFAIGRRGLAGAQKQSCRARPADAWIWAKAEVRRLRS
jgi:hypothetical protein